MEIFLLVLALLVNAACSQSVQCPGTYHAIGNGCYTFPEINSTWLGASLICQFSGGYLAKIDSEVEQMDLKAYHDEHFNNTVDFRWIGATDTLSYGTWRWVPSGASLEDYSNWAPDEPVLSTYYNCAAWSPDADNWSALSCCEEYSIYYYEHPLCEANPL